MYPRGVHRYVIAREVWDKLGPDLVKELWPELWYTNWKPLMKAESKKEVTLYILMLDEVAESVH